MNIRNRISTSSVRLVIFMACISLLASSVLMQLFKASADVGDRDLFLVAHQDDDLLFMNPDILASIRNGQFVRTIYFTAGNGVNTSDPAINEAYWRGREEGIKAAYAFMANVSNSWTLSNPTVGGKQIYLYTLNGNTKVSVVFLRLPDHGSSVNPHNLAGLWKELTEELHAVDDSNSFTKEGLINFGKDLMLDFNPTKIHIMDRTMYDEAQADHIDHRHAAEFANAAEKRLQTTHTVLRYRGYNISAEEANISGDEKLNIFKVYTAYDRKTCDTVEDNNNACTSNCNTQCVNVTNSPWYSWSHRQYYAQDRFTSFQNATDLQLKGDFINGQHDQVFFLNRNGIGGRAQIVDFINRSGPPAHRSYLEHYGDSPVLDGWHESDDTLLGGDFMGSGYDQVLCINKSNYEGRVQIIDFEDKTVPARRRYVAFDEQSQLLNGWLDSNDLKFVGDFTGVGHKQVLFINRSGAGGHLQIIDFNSGQLPPQIKYIEFYGESGLLDGWEDANDLQFVGDFMGTGHDQLMTINQSGSFGRIQILDFSGRSRPPIQVSYFETYGTPSLFDGWHDPGDIQLVGDFVGNGHTQVLFINQSGSFGRLQIVDFSGRSQPPAQVLYFETYGAPSLLDGWHDQGDIQLVGDFVGSGHDQLMLWNQSGSFGMVQILDFSGGSQPPAQRLYLESYGQPSIFDGWHDS